MQFVTHPKVLNGQISYLNLLILYLTELKNQFMSTVVININDSELSALKKFVRGAKAKMRVLHEDDIIEKLVEEGLKSETISLEQLKKELEKDARHP